MKNSKCAEKGCNNKSRYASGFCIGHHNYRAGLGPKPRKDMSIEELVDSIGFTRNGECLEWNGGFSFQGYGEIQHLGKRYPIHRYSFERYHRKLEKGELVMHGCDNRKCMNPEHLSAGTTSENIRDMWQKDRQAPNWLLKRDSCKAGHAYTSETLWVDGHGHRHCRVCSRKWSAISRERAKGNEKA